MDTPWTSEGAEGGSPAALAVAVQSVRFDAFSTQPAWLATLQTIEAAPEPQLGRPVQTVKPAVVPAPPKPKARPVPEGSLRGPQPRGPRQARWLLESVAAGHSGTRKLAEDLALSVLTQPSLATFHEAAREVLRDPELTVDRGLELAARLVELPPKRKRRKRDR